MFHDKIKIREPLTGEGGKKKKRKESEKEEAGVVCLKKKKKSQSKQTLLMLAAYRTAVSTRERWLHEASRAKFSAVDGYHALTVARHPIPAVKAGSQTGEVIKTAILTQSH